MLDQDNIELNCENTFWKQLFDMKSISKETQNSFSIQKIQLWKLEWLQWYEKGCNEVCPSFKKLSHTCLFYVLCKKWNHFYRALNRGHLSFEKWVISRLWEFNQLISTLFSLRIPLTKLEHSADLNSVDWFSNLVSWVAPNLNPIQSFPI